MIVLDEHLQGLGLKAGIGGWYRGRVCGITQLRPGTIIKDDAIPGILQRQVQPTFLTLNWSDFWGKVEPHPGFCLVGVSVPTDRAFEVPLLIRRLFRLPGFHTRAARMGKLARISNSQITYYSSRPNEIHLLPLPD